MDFISDNPMFTLMPLSKQKIKPHFYNTYFLTIFNYFKNYYFAVKSKLQLYLCEWLRRIKESITNEDNCFQNALDDALNYQTIKANPERISKLKAYINQ